MKNLIIIGALLMLYNTVCAQLKTVSFEELEQLQSVEERKVIVFMHTDWCQYCLRMKSSTFKNKEAQNLLNSNYYFIDFNAESQNAITFYGKKYVFKPSGINVGLHELAIHFGKIAKQNVFPATFILDAQGTIIFHSQSFLGPDAFKKLLESHTQ